MSETAAPRRKMDQMKESVKGVPIPVQPARISRCGMSRAKFAKRQVSGKWYELSRNGRSLGAPAEFDFYLEVESNDSVGNTETRQKELAEV